MSNIHDEINNRAREILSDSKILVDILVESENSRFMNVLKDGKIYFLRFISSDCYACVTMEDCLKLPVSTRYTSEDNRYELYGSKRSDSVEFHREYCSLVDKSNSIDYITKTAKSYCSFYKMMFIVEKETGRV